MISIVSLHTIVDANLREVEIRERASASSFDKQDDISLIQISKEASDPNLANSKFMKSRKRRSLLSPQTVNISYHGKENNFILLFEIAHKIVNVNYCNVY